MNNKKLGSKFEKDFAEYLSKKGYWVHYVEGSAHTGSQPCDLLACKNNEVIMIDCKTLENQNGLFPLSRIEENQRLAYNKAKKCGCEGFCLSIIWNNDIYIVPFDFLDFSKKSYDLKKNKPFLEGFYV